MYFYPDALVQRMGLYVGFLSHSLSLSVIGLADLVSHTDDGWAPGHVFACLVFFGSVRGVFGFFLTSQAEWRA